MSAKWMIGDVTGTIFLDGEPTGVEFKVYNGNAHEQLVREANAAAGMIDFTSNETYEVLEAISERIQFFRECAASPATRSEHLREGYEESIRELETAREKIRQACGNRRDAQNLNQEGRLQNRSPDDESAKREARGHGAVNPLAQCESGVTA